MLFEDHSLFLLLLSCVKLGIPLGGDRSKSSEMAQGKRNSNRDNYEGESFYYHYASISLPPSSSSAADAGPHGNGKTKGSGGFAPSKSTHDFSNLDYALTNSDTLSSTFGKIARVTILKDSTTRRSRGVAFIHRKVLNGRTLSASIAVDNGRLPELIRKRDYRDKSRCYDECGDSGHLR